MADVQITAGLNIPKKEELWLLTDIKPKHEIFFNPKTGQLRGKYNSNGKYGYKERYDDSYWRLVHWCDKNRYYIGVPKDTDYTQYRKVKKFDITEDKIVNGLHMLFGVNMGGKDIEDLKQTLLKNQEGARKDIERSKQEIEAYDKLLKQLEKFND